MLWTVETAFFDDQLLGYASKTIEFGARGTGVGLLNELMADGAGEDVNEAAVFVFGGALVHAC